MRYLLWILVILLSNIFQCLSQDEILRFEHISVEHGLSMTNVNCIIQDKAGFLWFGTEDGLNKYDGTGFKIYRHEPHSQNSLSTNRIYSMMEDSYDRIWLGTDYGLNWFDPRTESFHVLFPTYKEINTYEGQSIVSLYEDNNHILWIGFELSGLYKINLNNIDSLHSINFEPAETEGLKHGYISKIIQDLNEDLWVGTHHGLFRRNNITGEITLFEHDPQNSNSLSSNFITGLYEDKSGNLWISTENALHLFDRKKNTFSRFKIELGVQDRYPIWPITILEDSQSPGNLWLTSQNGLLYFNSIKGSFKAYKDNPQNDYSISGNYVMALCEDHSGVLWASIRSRGLNKLDQYIHRMTHYKHIPGNKNSLLENDVRSICEDYLGYIWLGTIDGLSRLDRSKNKFVHYTHNPYSNSSLSANRVMSIREDRKNRLWFGTAAGLNLYDRKKDSFRRIRNINADWNYIMVIYESSDGSLWLGTRAGLSNFNPETGIFNNIKPKVLVEGSKPFPDVTYIEENTDSTLWLATSSSGIYHFNTKDKTFIRYQYNRKDPNSLSNNNIYALHQDSSNVLWIATYGGGLNRFDPESKIFKSFTAENAGFPTNSLDGMVADNAGKLWISTDNGLVRFDPLTNDVRIFDMEHGIQSKEFHQGSQYKSKSGELFFGGINGFNCFYPKDIYKQNHIPPKVALTDFKLFGESVTIGNDSPLGEHISFTKKLELNHNQNDLSFEFAALHFTNPDGNQCAYKLEPYETMWREAQKSQTATYTNLDPGEYKFSVKAANSDGIWNEAGTSVMITIHSPWWAAWWAYSIYIVVTLAILFLVHKYEMNRINLRNQLRIEKVESEKFKELDLMKSRFFANISHEFRTPLTLVLGQVQSVLEEDITSKFKNKLMIAQRNAKRLLHLVSQLLDLSKLESGKMNLSLVRADVIPHLRNWFYAFESVAINKEINLNFETDQEKILLDFEPDKLEMIANNLLSNAIKFTQQEGTVSLSVKQQKTSSPPEIQICISDTGIGIEKEKLKNIFNRFYQVEDSDTRKYEGTGIGLAVVKELVGLHNGTISVESEPGKGTSFFVNLPAQQKGFEPKGESDFEIDSHKTSSVYESQDVYEEQNDKKGKSIILIVEDNSDLRSFIKSSLIQSYSVVEAGDGVQGLEKAQATIPDLIISDIMMPNMDGYQFSKTIRKDERTSHIPIIVLTAKASDKDKITGLEIGVDDYLIKPFNKEELLVRINNLISLRKQLREKFSKAAVIKPNDFNGPSVDQQFLKKVLDLIEEKMADELFAVPDIAETVNMSEAQLNRKLNAIIGQPPGQLIRSMRLQRAADMLKQSAGNIAEICYQVGFSDQANFTRSFKKQFGVAPTQYKDL